MSKLSEGVYNMQKNYMPEVAKLLGIEIGEKFNILNTDGEVIGSGPYVFTDKAIISWCEEELSSYVLFQLLKGKFTFIKQPWRPKDYEKYWTVFADGEIGCAHFAYSSARDLATLNMGNCFPTKEIAENAKPEILAKFDKISKGTLE